MIGFKVCNYLIGWVVFNVVIYVIVVFVVFCFCVLGFVVFMVLVVVGGIVVKGGVIIKLVESIECVRKVIDVVFDKIGIIIEFGLDVIVEEYLDVNKDEVYVIVC